MEKNIVVLPGDGIGPEVLAEAVKILHAVERRFGCSFALREALIGGAAYEAEGDPLPEETLAACRAADAVLLGAVGGPRWAEAPVDKRPEAGLLRIRKELGLYANLRPAVVFPELASLSCLRPDLVEQGLDLLVVRELSGDVYFGLPAGEERRDGARQAFNNMIYDEREIRRIAIVAFEAAMKRKRRLCSVDKANILAVSRLWREVVREVGADYPGVELSHMYVDNCAMQMVIRPAQFDVLLTANLFGDILSDEAAGVAGSLGLLPSASLSGTAQSGGIGLYEPVHGSAPDITGQDKANPLAAILSTAMMLDMTFGLKDAAVAVEQAVRRTLAEGFRTADIAAGQPGTRLASCREMGDLVAARLV
ncbi:MAG: 3-isopropylmalate dehydrogenase [Desulfovibrio sp.]|jgi:3-isopropylmalate dehydrogenase|nr:3-isopropylmalate dehydrogenase [Desulfovibrio sp.]